MWGVGDVRAALRQGDGEGGVANGRWASAGARPCCYAEAAVAKNIRRLRLSRAFRVLISLHGAAASRLLAVL